MNAKYCYWSVATGEYGALMEHCVGTARAAGVFKEFHVLTDRPLAGCECYDAFQCDKSDGLFKLHYLKAGMSRLNFEYFVWLDADTVFVRNPVDVLAALGRSPLHVPLEVDLSALKEDRDWKGVSCFRLREFFRQEGIANAVYLSRSAFWIIHHDAIEPVYELALSFWHRAKAAGLPLGVDAALGYAMQLWCADTESHVIGKHPDLWADGVGAPWSEAAVDGALPEWRPPSQTSPGARGPATLPWAHRSRLARGEQPECAEGSLLRCGAAAAIASGGARHRPG